MTGPLYPCRVGDLDAIEARRARVRSAHWRGEHDEVLNLADDVAHLISAWRVAEAQIAVVVALCDEYVAKAGESAWVNDVRAAAGSVRRVGASPPSTHPSTTLMETGDRGGSQWHRP